MTYQTMKKRTYYKIKFFKNRDTDSSFNESTRHPVTIEEKELEPPIEPYNISYQESVEIEESLSLEEREKELIKKA